MPRTSSNSGINPMPPFGGVGTTTTSPTVSSGKTGSRISPVQVVGFVPFVCCTNPECTGRKTTLGGSTVGGADPAGLPPIRPTVKNPFSQCDCREWLDDDCYMHPVFASSTCTDILQNDFNSFLLEYPFYHQYLQNNPSLSLWSLQKYCPITNPTTGWITQTTLSNNNYGQNFAFNSICSVNKRGYRIDWRKVLLAFGEGTYRIQVTSSIYGVPSCAATEVFNLKEFTCERADKTVRFEAKIIGGRIGSIDDDRRIFDFCCPPTTKSGQFHSPAGITWDDSIRMPGFFGYEKTEYERTQIEYQTGDVKQIRNEAIQKFEFHSGRLPKTSLDRLKAYGHMANELFVTDYNWSNSDYFVKRKGIVCDGAFEPQYQLVKGESASRLAHVKVEYKEWVQNVIRDTCCSIPSLRPR